MHTGLMLLFPIYPVISYGLLLMVPPNWRVKTHTSSRLQKTWRICARSMEVRLYMLHYIGDSGGDTLPCHRGADIGNGTEIIY